MKRLNRLKEAYKGGYSSGNILSLEPDPRRKEQERLIGGNYYNVFEAIKPYVPVEDARIIEIGPGKGSWTRAFLDSYATTVVDTIDVQDVTQWIDPKEYSNRLACHQVTDDPYAVYNELTEDEFDLCFSFGVFCHLDLEDIEAVLKHTFSKVMNGSHAIHHYSDWKKLDKYGWEKGGIPAEFKTKGSDYGWWVENNADVMRDLAIRTGWTVVNEDMDLVDRDGIILLQKWED